MANGLRRFGDWDRLQILSHRLRKELIESCNISVMIFALTAEKIAKEHIANQDLGWPPLSPNYVAWKARKGMSTKTLVRTSTYFQSITGWREGFTGFAGVKKTAREPDGTETANIAKVHEYGSNKVPARPLWQPTFQEAFTKWNAESTPLHIYRRRNSI